MANLRFRLFAGVICLGLLLPVCHVYGQKFLPDDPVRADRDRISIPEPRKIDLSKAYDFLENTFYDPGLSHNQRAVNINTLGEVPDSSWFTNRIGLQPMSIEELVRGPNKGNGPDISQPLTITGVKSEGITPGFTVKDSRGIVYIVKFDPLKYPQLATSIEVIGTKFFHAFGYNVPENYLAYFRRDQLKIAPDAKFEDKEGKKRKLKDKDVDTVLKQVPRREDGTIQAVASRYLSGKPLGPFKYYGTRSDDPNDIFPHEDRRELRGHRVFSAWLNHNDSDATNSLDMYVTEGDRKYVKHHLIDFGTTLGSGAFVPKARRAGNEYYLEWEPLLKSALTFGIWDRPWRYVKYPDYPAIGRFESAFFAPEEWKADYPNPAHTRMQPEDAFWATRIVMRFNDDMIRAIVRTGEITDSDAESYLVKTLIERRDKVIRYYLGLINPLDEFKVAGRNLTFRNLGAEAKLSPESSYRFQWFQFDNQQLSLKPLGEVRSASSPSLPVPDDSSPFLMVRIETVVPSQKNWNKKVEVYLRNSPEKSVVGIEREN